MLRVPVMLNEATALELFKRKMSEMYVGNAHCMAMAFYGRGFESDKRPHPHLLKMDKRSAKRKMRAIRKYYAGGGNG